MKQVKVRITKAKRWTYWYANSIGEAFDVYERGSRYVLKEDYDRGQKYPWFHIDSDDCEIVEEPL